MRNNTAVIDAMTEDWNRFLSVAQTDREGNRLNIIKVDGVDSTDEKVIGKRLQEIAKNATTGGLYTQVGELYGFPIKVVSERILKEGLEFTDNRFVVEGNYKYTYNNGHLAMADPLAAAAISSTLWSASPPSSTSTRLRMKCWNVRYRSCRR